MSTLGKVLTIGAAAFGFFVNTEIRAHETSVKAQPSTSAYAQSMGRKMGANYEFNCPDQIETGNVEAVELTIKTAISADELNRLIQEESHRFRSKSKASPCLVAHLDFIETNGLVVKSITNSHQKLIPYGQNQWTWQLKGRKPGEYLLSLTISLCADGDHGEPLATPIAFNRKIKVIGEPLPDTNKSAIILIAGIALALGGLVVKGLFVIRRKLRDRRIKVLPGGEQKIFISYSKHDRKKVEPVIEHLKASGHKIWIDRHGIEGASSWRAEIVDALTNSKYLLFFASKTSYQSVNVGKELSLAADENLVIIPVLLENCQPNGAGKFIVAGLQRIDARNRTAKEVASDLAFLLSKNISNFMRTPKDDKPGKNTHSSIFG